MRELFQTPLNFLHVSACLFLILVVLVQPGKGGGLGAFGGSGAQQVFGGRGAGNWLTRLTWWTAATFFLTSLTLAYFSSSTEDSLERASSSKTSIEKRSPGAPASKAPGAPAPGK
jgi:preprotein translocase subunit SecG